MPSVLSIDLNKNPEVAALVADMAPGAKLYACFTIKDMDDQTLNVRLKEMAGSCDELKENASEDDDEDSDQSPEGEEAEEPAKEEPVARKLARQIESNAPDGY